MTREYEKKDPYKIIDEWGISESDYQVIDGRAIEEITLGANILATGGGGDPEIGLKWAKNVLDEDKDIVMVQPEVIPDEIQLACAATLGAPIVLTEKPPAKENTKKIFYEMERYLDRPIEATFPIECGGVNSPIGYAVGGELGLPVIDVDGMNRAFPELQMTTFATQGVPATPVVTIDDHHHCCVVDMGEKNKVAEDIVRNIAMKYGGISWIGCYPMTGKELKETGVLHSQSLAWNLGKTVMEARRKHDDPIESILEFLKSDRGIPGAHIFTGKVMDIDRDFGSETTHGFSMGRVTLEGIEEYEGQDAYLEFQNEWLVAKIDGEIKCLPPDMIALLDPETGEPIRTDLIRYGYRVKMIAMPAHKNMRTPEGIETFGPRYFGFDVDYTPVEKLLGIDKDE